jgi:hypothetical protein
MGLRADRPFFRRTVGSFLDRQLSEGRRSAIILEGAMQYPFFDKTNLEHKLAEKGLDFNSAMRARLALFEIYTVEGCLIENPQSDKWSWGFERTARGISETNPGMIEVVTEPQSIEVFLKLSQPPLNGGGMPSYPLPGRTYQEKVNFVAAFITAFIEAHQKRDKLVFKLSESLSEQDPSRAIIIPRGYGHRGMSVYFTPENYRVTICEKGSNSTPLDDAFKLSYARLLSPIEIDRYAKMYIDWLRLNAMTRLNPKIRRAAHESWEALAGGYSCLHNFFSGLRGAIAKGVVEWLHGKE